MKNRLIDFVSKKIAANDFTLEEELLLLQKMNSLVTIFRRFVKEIRIKKLKHSISES